MKNCIECKIDKELSEFHKCKNAKDRHSNNCKSCRKEYDSSRDKTLSGLVSGVYDRQRQSSRAREHSLPAYSKYELIDWVLRQKLSWELFKDWENSNYNTELKLSIDRLKDNLPYTFCNIRVCTWRENIEKEWRRKNKSIKSINKVTKEERTYKSIKLACEDLALSPSQISNVLSKLSKTAGGYYFELI